MFCQNFFYNQLGNACLHSTLCFKTTGVVRRLILSFFLFVFGMSANAFAETKLLLGKQTLATPLDPIELTVPIGEKVTIKFPVLSGNIWFKDNVPIVNQDSRTFTIESVTPDDAGVYRVMYTSSHPIDSQSLVLKIATSVTTISETPHFLTFTTRATAGAGAQALVTGFVVGEVLGNPSAEKTILVRAVGPTLAQFGMEGALAAPRLAIYDQAGQLRHPQLSDQEELKSAQQRSGAFPLTPGAADAVQILRLPAGTYTAQVTGAEGNSGLVLLEVYDVPH